MTKIALDIWKGRIYNLILSPEISEEERLILIEAKNDLENKVDFRKVTSILKVKLAPIAMKGTMTKELLHFYSDLLKEFPKKDKLGHPGGILFMGCFLVC